MSKIKNLWSKSDTPTNCIINLSYIGIAIGRLKEIDCRSKVELNYTLHELIFIIGHVESMDELINDLAFNQTVDDLKNNFINLGRCELLISKDWFKSISTKDDYEYKLNNSIAKLRKVILHLITKLEDENLTEKRQMSNDTA